MALIQVELPPYDGSEYFWKDNQWVLADITGANFTCDSQVKARQAAYILHNTDSETLLDYDTPITGFDSNGGAVLAGSDRIDLAAGLWMMWAHFERDQHLENNQSRNRIRIGDTYYTTWEGYFEGYGTVHSCNMLMLDLAGATNMRLYGKLKREYTNSAHTANGAGCHAVFRVV